MSSFSFKKRENTYTFGSKYKCFHGLVLLQDFFFSSASGKLFYLDLLSEQGRELCHNKCSIDWLYFYSWDRLCSLTEVSRENHWEGTEKPVSLTAAYIRNYFSSIIV